MQRICHLDGRRTPLQLRTLFTTLQSLKVPDLAKALSRRQLTVKQGLIEFFTLKSEQMLPGNLIFLLIAGAGAKQIQSANSTSDSTDSTDEFVGKRMTWYSTDTGPGKPPRQRLQFEDGCCGKQLRITYDGKSTIATCVDECATCPEVGQLDLTKGLFEFFVGDPGIGEFYGSWSHVQDNLTGSITQSLHTIHNSATRTGRGTEAPSAAMRRHHGVVTIIACNGVQRNAAQCTAMQRNAPKCRNRGETFRWLIPSLIPDGWLLLSVFKTELNLFNLCAGHKNGCMIERECKKHVDPSSLPCPEAMSISATPATIEERICGGETIHPHSAPELLRWAGARWGHWGRRRRRFPRLQHGDDRAVPWGDVLPEPRIEKLFLIVIGTKAQGFDPLETGPLIHATARRARAGG
ncbi:hypothetical protein B0H13DRAFT_1869830 [Mycena leptocephala]|nr:hypothetical protein B0H13DRAFT_1869830 [Mycena leptocephala]